MIDSDLEHLTAKNFRKMMETNKQNIDYTKSVTGVAYSKDDAKITLIGVEDKPGVAANIFEPLNKVQINVDMVIQSVAADNKTTDIKNKKIGT